ncbi:MAG: LPS export ABC transporter periplasmic protein LptC, partial [Acidobacteriota bacterium]|nr:LPS export ABC transporter periplasmic protein LptC [Acidobacteriota bacterium]
MRKFVLALTFVAAFVLTNAAQTPTPTPVSVDDDVVKISTTLIQVDVTVTDKNGKIIRDLKSEDFEIFENDEKQDITNFSFVTAASEPVQTTIKPKTSEKNSAQPLPTVALRP